MCEVVEMSMDGMLLWWYGVYRCGGGGGGVVGSLDSVVLESLSHLSYGVLCTVCNNTAASGSFDVMQGV